MTTRNEVFLDTSFAVALVLRQDEYHTSATQLGRQLRMERRHIVTTDAVVLELGNALARNPFRPLVIRLIDRLRNDPMFSIVALEDRIMNAGHELFVQHADKSWTLVDCISFVVMRERGITDSLTADRHFQQAGFRALLLEDS
ncbi:PIN domain-containing protein [soil metagenome]